MITKPQTYRIDPESIFKLKLLSLGLSIPIWQLFKLMIDDLWEQKKDEVTGSITSQQSNREAARILKKMRTK